MKTIIKYLPQLIWSRSEKLEQKTVRSGKNEIKFCKHTQMGYYRRCIQFVNRTASTILFGLKLVKH